MRPPEIDLMLGLEVYVTRTPPVPARLGEKPWSFVVEEVPLPGLVVPGEARYAVYLVEKHMATTPQAIAAVARLLGVPRSLVGYAGLKDKDAVARQLVTVPARLAKRLPGEASLGRVRLRLLGYARRPLRRGMLAGNRFQITLVADEPGDACRAFEELLGLGGIPGYYGYQRFGTRRPNTHRVGALLVRRLWLEAVHEIAGHPYPWEHPRSIEARRLFDEGRVAEALERYPPSLRYERVVAARIAGGRSPLEALRALPRWLLELYVEAYASYLYNKMLSRKLVEAGLDPAQPLEGEAPPGCSGDGVRRGACTPRLPVPGHGLEKLGARGRARSLAWEVLGEESVDPAGFRVEELGVEARARWRASYAPLRNASCAAAASSARLAFELPPGMYASIVLREVAKRGPAEMGL